MKTKFKNADILLPLNIIKQYVKDTQKRSMIHVSDSASIKLNQLSVHQQVV
jgi:hypothetical protein